MCAFRSGSDWAHVCTGRVEQLEHYWARRARRLGSHYLPDDFVIRAGQKRVKNIRIWPKRGRDGPRSHRVNTLTGKNTTKSPARLQQVNSGNSLVAAYVDFSAKNGHNWPKMTQILKKGPRRIKIWVNLTIFWGKIHKDRPHWATATLLRKFSRRNMDFLARKGQNWPKNDPKLEKGPQRVRIWIN